MILLSETDIEHLLKDAPELETFWTSHAPRLIFRSTPCLANPVYELQLAYDLEDRLETYCWLWMDALEGNILLKFPEK